MEELLLDGLIYYTFYRYLFSRREELAKMGISIYAKPAGSAFSEQVLADLRGIVSAENGVLQIHGFSADEETKEIRFDVVIGFDAKDREATFADIVSQLTEKYPDCRIMPVLDADVTDF